VSLSVRVPLGSLGVRLHETVRDSERWAPEMGHLCYGSSVRETRKLKAGTVDGDLFPWGLVVKPGRGLICRGLMCGRTFWDGCLSL